MANGFNEKGKRNQMSQQVLRSDTMKREVPDAAADPVADNYRELLKTKFKFQR